MSTVEALRSEWHERVDAARDALVSGLICVRDFIAERRQASREFNCALDALERHSDQDPDDGEKEAG